MGGTLPGQLHNNGRSEHGHVWEELGHHARYVRESWCANSPREVRRPRHINGLPGLRTGHGSIHCPAATGETAANTKVGARMAREKSMQKTRPRVPTGPSKACSNCGAARADIRTQTDRATGVIQKQRPLDSAQ